MNHSASDQSYPRTDDQHRRRSAHRFLWIFGSCVLLIASVVASVNLLAYRYMLSDDNQAIVQLLSGWGRIYKPILYDEIKPEIAVFGASWARDAFDPLETSRLLGRRVFNHGGSGDRAGYFVAGIQGHRGESAQGEDRRSAGR